MLRFESSFLLSHLIEYDWGQKGLDKDLLARKWLGKELYQTNKFRLGIEEK